MVPYGERSRFEEALKEKGPPFMPDEWGGNFTPWKNGWESSRRRHSTTKSVVAAFPTSILASTAC